MDKSKFITAIVLAALIVPVAGKLRPKGNIINSGLDVREFWSNKSKPAHPCDMVLVGDSRVCIGLSPAAMEEGMEEGMEEYRVFNFGFDGTGFSDMFLERAEGLLEASSGKKIIVLGITPHSLTPSAARSNQFLEQKKEKGVDAWIDGKVRPALKYFDPMDSHAIFLALTGRKREYILYHHHHIDGWMASRQVPHAQKGTLAHYRRLFNNNRVSRALIDQVMDSTRTWAAKGIKVFAFSPPTTVEMIALEKEVSGFDEASFRERFKSAGGIWLDVDQTGYSSFDGSHLDEESAIKFSRDLAEMIKSYME